MTELSAPTGFLHEYRHAALPARMRFSASTTTNLINDPGLVQELEAVRNRAGAGHMSLLRVFDVMCWMFSWEGEHGPCSQEMPD